MGCFGARISDIPLHAVESPGARAGWRDEYPFLLRAIEIARGQIQPKESPLTQGEAWALTRILERVQQHPDRQATDSIQPGPASAFHQRLAWS